MTIHEPIRLWISIPITNQQEHTITRSKAHMSSCLRTKSRHSTSTIASFSGNQSNQGVSVCQGCVCGRFKKSIRDDELNTPLDVQREQSGSSPKHEIFVERAATLAQKSDILNHKHGCVIISNRGKIIAEGYNYFWRNMSVHAEIDALSKVKNLKSLGSCSMYVVRIGTAQMGHPLKYSRPCEDCTGTILKYGIGKVYYSTSYDSLMCSNWVSLKTGHKKSVDTRQPFHGCQS